MNSRPLAPFFTCCQEFLPLSHPPRNRMLVNRPAFLSWFTLPAALMLLSVAAPAGAQAPPVIPANPLAPTLAPVVPLGMQRGTKLELTLTGTNLAEPTGLWTSFPAKVT